MIFDWFGLVSLGRGIVIPVILRMGMVWIIIHWEMIDYLQRMDCNDL